MSECQLDATFKINVGHDRGRAVRACNNHLADTLNRAIRKSEKAVVFPIDNHPISSAWGCQYGDEIWKEVLGGSTGPCTCCHGASCPTHGNRLR